MINLELLFLTLNTEELVLGDKFFCEFNFVVTCQITFIRWQFL